MAEKRTIVFFDFDRTLITGDSLWPFLGFAAGWPRTIIALLQSFSIYARHYLKDKNDPIVSHLRTFMKTQLLQRLLAGTSSAQLAPALEKLRRWQKWNKPVWQKLQDHHAAGHHIVIATGSLSLYLPALIKDIPHHGVLCTDVEVKNDIITGVMINGNCVRKRKAERVAEYLKTRGPFDETWGYGNAPHDLPMLELLQNRVVI